jgi:hypothetical protein
VPVTVASVGPARRGFPNTAHCGHRVVARASLLYCSSLVSARGRHFRPPSRPQCVAARPGASYMPGASALAWCYSESQTCAHSLRPESPHFPFPSCPDLAGSGGGVPSPRFPTRRPESPGGNTAAPGGNPSPPAPRGRFPIPAGNGPGRRGPPGRRAGGSKLGVCKLNSGLGCPPGGRCHWHCRFRGNVAAVHTATRGSGHCRHPTRHRH